jgi:ribosomal protein L7/L12
VELFVGILIGACLAITAVVVLGFRALRTRRSGSDLTQVTFDPDLMVRVRALAAAGERVQAIKMLRESTPNLGLGQASLLVDRMAKSATRQEAAGEVAAPRSSEITPGGAGITPEGSEIAARTTGDGHRSDLDPRMFEDAPSSSAVDLEVELEVRALRSDGKSDDAVQLLQQHTGWDKRTAEDYISAL